MRDYKNVKVPKSYLAGEKRSSVKRVLVNRTSERTERKRGGTTGVLLKVMAAVLIAGAAVLAWQGYLATMRADMFMVSGVDVRGAKHLGEKDLREIAGLFRGQNIFRADLGAAVRRARVNPWVKDARIHRSLPNRITMAVTERVPSVILDTGADRFLMDDEGMIVERLAKDNAPAWPLPVVAIRGCRARPGEPVASEGLTEAMQLLAEISSRGGWRPAEVTVRADSPEALSVEYADHEFKIGSGRYGEKLRRLAEVMADVKERGIEIAYVDLRPERQTAVMPKKVQSSEFGVRSSEKKANKGQR
ncbi:MAG TPA: FtsQ-type POTRA domain-containing protein [Nitrospirota bacterium]|nr:FtsQ-type POTRA domain-containing protein [Nitrospirota bacterium]